MKFFFATLVLLAVKALLPCSAQKFQVTCKSGKSTTLVRHKDCKNGIIPGVMCDPTGGNGAKTGRCIEFGPCDNKGIVCTCTTKPAPPPGPPPPAAIDCQATCTFDVGLEKGKIFTDTQCLNRKEGAEFTPLFGHKRNCYEMVQTCDDGNGAACFCERSPEVEEDPHFTTWGGLTYYYFGLCDVIALKNPDFQS
jgi:hypothetical protein